MRPAHLEPYGSYRDDRQIRSHPQHSHSQGNSRRLQSEDSWVEISSQPSSSSLASQADEIITTGLQVRRTERPRTTRLGDLPKRSTSAAGSSQDEYDESESESDRVMTSSTEDVTTHYNGEDEDDTQTALGVGTNRNIFTPQPNAFSHPSGIRSTPGPDSYFPPTQPPPASSYRLPSGRVPTISRPPIRERHSSSSIQPDHDAALRASLTTLLSCAAAVRKDKSPSPVVRRSTQPTALRLVSAAEMNAPTTIVDHTIPTPVRMIKPAQKRRSRESSKERQAKKIKPIKPIPSEELLVSPTMMTWFISAGFVIVFSALSFTAGYAWGREVGRVEGQIGLETSCGQEAIRGSRTGLGKLRLASARV